MKTIKKYLELKKIEFGSVPNLARALNISTTALSCILNGKVNRIHSSTVEKIITFANGELDLEAVIDEICD